MLGTVPELAVWVHGVAGAPPNPGAGEVARGFQVGHDGLHGALGETDDGADLADPGFGVPGYLHEDVPVPGQQRPAVATALLRRLHDLILTSRESSPEMINTSFFSWFN